MTSIELRAAAELLVTLITQVQWCFGRKETIDHATTYVRGLLLHEGQKSIEPMALRFAQGKQGEPAGRKEVQALQHFITASPWDYQLLQQEIQRQFAEQLVSRSSSPIGTVGVIDESGDEKSGSQSCGAASQWFGRQGKRANCQMGVFLLGAAAAGTALLDHQLFLPADWAKDKARRKKTHVPREIEFQTKPEIAGELLRRTVAAGHVKFDWITADELYGRSAKFLDVLDELKLRYVVEVPVNTTFYIRDPAAEPGAGGPKSKSVRALLRSAKQLAATLQADAWQPVLLREGAKGPLVAEFARLRVWAVRRKNPHYAVWLMFRRDLETNEMHYFVSNADETVSLEETALASAERIKVEEYFQDGKGHLGFADYEARGWNSWHHHMSMVALAHLYVVLARHQLQASLPELTLDRTVALMQAALDRPQLTVDDALRLLNYHLHHNAVAHQSHRKSWLERHKEIVPKLLL